MPSARKSDKEAKDPLRVPKDTKVAKATYGRSKLQNERIANCKWSHLLPGAQTRSKNGRVPGRALVNWLRPRMIEKAFLHLLYECEIRNIDLPLDFVAHRLCPGATGEAMTQRAERLRKELIAEGHVVPPKAGKKGTNLNAEIRGHIRKYPGDAKNLLETRDVLFTEPMEDVAHADPTAYMLVHNRQSRDKRVKATAGSGKNVIHDAHHNSDSESSDSAGESEVDETPKKSRHSARLRSVPKKSLKEASDNDAEDEDDSYNESATSVSHLGYSDSVGAADYGVNIKDEDDGEALLGGRSDRVPPQQYQVPDSLAAYGGVNVTPGSFADAEDNDLSTPSRFGHSQFGSSSYGPSMPPSHAFAVATGWNGHNGYTAAVDSYAQHQTFVSGDISTGEHTLLPAPTYTVGECLGQLDRSNRELHHLASEQGIRLEEHRYEAPVEDHELNQMIINASSPSRDPGCSHSLESEAATSSHEQPQQHVPGDVNFNLNSDQFLGFYGYYGR